MTEEPKNEQAETRPLLPPQNVLVQRASSEVQEQIRAAHEWPRRIDDSREMIRALSCHNVEIADRCTYSFQREGKVIEGATIVYACIVARGWTNLWVSGHVVGHDGKWVTAVGECWDLQANIRIQRESRRKITYGKKDSRVGQTFTEDMITLFGMGAVSIAQRNAILAVVPEPFWHDIWEASRKVALGTEETLESRRNSMVQWYDERGVTPDQLMAILDKPNKPIRCLEDVDLRGLRTMRQLASAIREGETSVSEVLSRLGPEPTPTAGTKRKNGKPASLRDAMEQDKAEKVDNGERTDNA